jgi:hypothetical protein
MPIDWMKHSIALSKRWGITTRNTPSTAVGKGEHEQDPSPPSPPQEEIVKDDSTGTRFYVHATFALHFGVQLLNAVIQHRDTPMYLVYIVLLHGPVLLFIVWMVQIFQQVIATAFLGLPKHAHFDVILSSMGGLTMLPTTNVPQDVKVSMMIPLGHVLLLFFWLAWYIVLDGGQFDETLTSGVDFDELSSSLWGLLSNVAAQAMWLCVTLAALHMVVPVFPLSGASFLAACLSGYGLGLVKSAVILDIVGAVLSLVMLTVGLQQTFLDDQNGLGVFILFNSLLLVLLGLQRSMCEPVEQHLLVTRECYNEKEEITEHDNEDYDDDNLVDARPRASHQEFSSEERHHETMTTQEGVVGVIVEPDKNTAMIMNDVDLHDDQGNTAMTTTSSPNSDAHSSAMMVNQTSEDLEEMELV